MKQLSTKIFMAVLATLALTGCNRYQTTLKAGDKDNTKSVTVRDIAMIVPNAENPWTRLQIEYATMAAKAENVTLHVIPISGSDEESVQSALGAAAAARCTGAMIQAPSETAGIFVRDQAESFGISIVTINQRLRDVDSKKFLNLPYYGIENRDLGSFLVQSALEEVAKRGWKASETGILVMTQDDGGKFAARGQAISDTLRSNGYDATQIKILRSASRAEAQSQAANAIGAGKPNWLILGANDGSVLGAADAATAKGMGAENVIGASIGGLGALDELAKPANGFFATLLVGPRAHSYATLQRLVKAMRAGLTVDPLPDYNIGVWITRENLAEATKSEMLDKLPAYAKTLQP